MKIDRHKWHMNVLIYEKQNSLSIEVIFSMTTKLNTQFMCPDNACSGTLNNCYLHRV